MKSINNFLELFEKKYNLPEMAVRLDIYRIGLFLFLIYKVLNRDYENLVLFPEENWNFGPMSIYSPFDYGFLSPKFLFDIFCFHFIHWFKIVPYPNKIIFVSLEYLIIFFSILIILFGRGPKNIFVILTYILCTYLMGYVNRTQENEFLLMQGLIFIHCFMKHEDNLTIFKPKILTKYHETYGNSFSLIICVFVIYYFGSGTTKLTDINLIDWFIYDLREEIVFVYLKQELAGLPFYVPKYFYDLTQIKFYNFYILDIISYFGPAMSYFSHLMSPLLFWYRDRAFFLGIFYVAFHFLTMGVAIAFVGNMLMWLLMLPYHKLFISKDIK